MKITKTTKYECDSCGKKEEVVWETATLKPGLGVINPNSPPTRWISVLVIDPALMAPAEVDPNQRTLHCRECATDIRRLLRALVRVAETA